MYFNFRVISKIGLLLVAIGFFMPIVSVLTIHMSGFLLADFLINFEQTSSGVLLYALFAFALTGTVIGALLLFKINVPPLIDCLVTLICVVGSWYFATTLQGEGLPFLSGIYVMLTGSTIALFTQLLWSLSYLDPTDYKVQFSLAEFDTKLQRLKNSLDS